MHRPPYMNIPFPFYKNYHRASYFSRTSPNVQPNIMPTITPPAERTNFYSDGNIYEEHNCDFQTAQDLKQKNKSNKYNNSYLFDLFGLKIYNDDILLVSLIYFLYSEGVKDDGLFLVLVLLLLS